MTLKRPVPSGLLAWPAAALGYALAALVYLRPIWRVGGDRIAPSLDDPLLLLYVLKWGARQVRLGLPDFWNANLFHPTPGALTLSDHMLGPAAQLAVIRWLVPNAIAGFNVLFFTAFVATALAVCWVCRRAGLSWAASLLAGWMYAFSPHRVSQMAHLQLLIAQWAPLTLWFWDRLLAERTVKRAVPFVLFYLLHVTGGCYLAYMIHVPMLAILLVRATAEGWEILSFRSLRVLLPAGLIAGAAVIAIFLPYARVSGSLGLERTEEEIRRFGAKPVSYVTPSRENLYFGPDAKDFLRARFGIRAKEAFDPDSTLFSGFLPTALFLVGTVSRFRRRREGPPDLWERGLAVSGALCFLLSFSAVYAPLMRIVPGMSGMRVPSRFYAFVSLALVHFAGRGVDALRERMPGPRSRAALVAALAAVLLVELAPRPLRWVPLEREEDFPAVYRWIAREPGIRALIELPIHADTRENRYLYYSTAHWKPLANGFSGYFPPAHERLTERVRFLPDEEGLDLIRGLGISHVVVHADSPARAAALRQWEERFAGEAERVYQDGETAVYRLASSRTPNRAGL
jgi:hypothetical protein